METWLRRSLPSPTGVDGASSSNIFVMKYKTVSINIFKSVLTPRSTDFLRSIESYNNLTYPTEIEWFLSIFYTGVKRSSARMAYYWREKSKRATTYLVPMNIFKIKMNESKTRIKSDGKSKMPSKNFIKIDSKYKLF